MSILNPLTSQQETDLNRESPTFNKHKIGTIFKNIIAAVNAGQVSSIPSAIGAYANSAWTALTTTAKDTIVNAINEVVADVADIAAAALVFTNKTFDAKATGNYAKNLLMAYTGTFTLAQLNAGIICVAGSIGKTIRVLRYAVTVNGDFSGGGGNSIILEDTNSSLVVIATILKAALTAGAKISSGATIANVTEGAGMTANLTSGSGIAIAADAALSVGTSINITIYYMYV
jgi:hypothetical protein